MKIRKEVETLSGYEPGNESVELRMDKNESPFGLPPEIKSRVLERLERIEFNRYPDKLGSPLRRDLSQHVGVSRDQLVVGNGSDELILYILQLFSGHRVVVFPPTFSVYGIYGKLSGYDVIEAPLDEEFELNSDFLEVVHDAGIVFLCSPNNPTGNSFSREKIVRILETDTPLVLDEAYWEFSGETNLDLIDDYKNLILLRTFSKAFGIAGARVGYAVANQGLIDRLLRIKLPYNLNSLSRTVAEVVLANYGIVEDRVETILAERKRMVSEFADYCYPTQTNFVLMDIDAKEFLASRGIGVRGFEGRLGDKIRVTVGKKEENDRLIDELRGYLEDEN